MTPVTLFRKFKPQARYFSGSPAHYQERRHPLREKSGVTIPPKGMAIALTMLAITSLGSIASGAYWIFREDLLDAATKHHKAVETAYQDHIDRLRSEIDRLNSRQALDRQSVEEQVADLLEQHKTLYQRHSIVTELMERAERSGIRLAVQNPIPTSKPDGIRAIESALSKDDTSAIGGESEPLENPFKALGLRGSDSFETRKQSAIPGDQAALLKVEAGIISMRQESTVALDALAVAAEKQIDTISAAIRPLGVSVEISDENGRKSAIGGPYVPYFSTNFSGRVNRAKRALSTLENIKVAAQRLPIQRPVKSVTVSSHFGPRVDPFLGRIAMHTGMDFKAAYGTRVYATAPGTIVHAGWKGGYGKLVSIRHKNGLVTRYAHLSRMHVTKGDHVAAGDVIGSIGSTGRSTGPHLHYEVRVGKDAIDPAAFVVAGDRISSLISK